MTTPSIDRPGDRQEYPRSVTEIRIADAAATAARATPGVLHLQPGWSGLVHQLGCELWTRFTGEPRPDTAGVDVTIDESTVTIDVTLVADGLRPAAAVAADVQQRVHHAVRHTCAATPTQVAVHVCEIALPA